MKKTNFNLFLPVMFLCGSFFFSSCDKKEKDEPTERTFGNGIYVTNEGNFNKANGDVSFINKENKAVEKGVFQAANGRTPGDVIQSMLFHNGKAYLVVNNSGTIEVTNASTFKSEGVISGLKSPRYMVVSGTKGYVTEWVSFGMPGRVAVINLADNTILKTIPTGKLPEKMLVYNNKLYVTNSDDAFLTVINTLTDMPEGNISTTFGSNSLALDAANKLWVLSTGVKSYNSNGTVNIALSTPGSLSRINPANNAVEQTLPFASAGAFAEDLTMNTTGNTMYYTYDFKVFKMETSATTLPANAFINRSFYGLGFDPVDKNIYGADAGSYTSAGKVIRYTTAGTAIDSFSVGLVPNGFYFK